MSGKEAQFMSYSIGAINPVTENVTRFYVGMVRAPIDRIAVVSSYISKKELDAVVLDRFDSLGPTAAGLYRNKGYPSMNLRNLPGDIKTVTECCQKKGVPIRQLGVKPLSISQLEDFAKKLESVPQSERNGKIINLLAK